MNKERRFLVSAVKMLQAGIAALLICAILPACGIKPTAAAGNDGGGAKSAASATDPAKMQGEKKTGDAGKQDKQAKREQMSEKLKKAWEAKGVTPADADKIISLLKSGNFEPRWVMEQLKAGRKASDIIRDLRSGKAPKKEAASGNKDAGTADGRKKETQKQDRKDSRSQDKKKDTGQESDSPASSA
jgi:hypothetical protein